MPGSCTLPVIFFFLFFSVFLDTTFSRSTVEQGVPMRLAVGFGGQGMDKEPRRTRFRIIGRLDLDLTRRGWPDGSETYVEIGSDLVFWFLTSR